MKVNGTKDAKVSADKKSFDLGKNGHSGLGSRLIVMVRHMRQRVK